MFDRYFIAKESCRVTDQFGYTETYAVLAEGKLTVVSGAFLSVDMTDRQNFVKLMTKFAENIKY